MNEARKPQPRRRPGKNTFTTRSGSTIKLNRSLGDRLKASREAKARRRAVYLSTLPKNKFKRILFRLKPRELIRFWFSRDGAIMSLKITGIAIVVFFVLIVGVFAYFRKDLPNIKDISGTNIGGSITYYARDGQTVLFQDYDAVKRIPVTSDSINDSLKNATVAIEDKDFYKHGAFDVRGITRAGVNDVFGGGGVTQGGSTITQQLVKLNQDWTADRTITRKVKEVILAVELEREYSKQDILTGYLNVAPYGPVEYGAQVAANDYFGIDAKNLTLAQATMLAAIPKSPNVYSPYGPRFSSADLLGRQHYIIDQMLDQKMITKQQADEAKKVDVLAQVKPRSQKFNGIKAPYFVLAAKQQLEEKYGTETVKRGGWKVVTTVDLRLQDLAEKAVQDDRRAIQAQGGDTAAFVAEDNKTGQIVALVGGVDFNDTDHGQINYATDVNVSPGSTFKPYDYATFIENNNAGAGTVLFDDKTPQNALPGYACTKGGDPDQGGNCLLDYDWKSRSYPGALTLRYALGGSRNVPAVKAMLAAVPGDKSNGRVNSINKTISTAEALMGVQDGYNCYAKDTYLGPDADPAVLKSSQTQCYGASAIGDGAYLKLDDHANGIASIARMGVSIPHTYILKITDASNKTLDEFKQPAGKQVIRQDTAYIVTDMASDPNASYLPGSCNDTTCRQFSQGGSNFKFQRYNGWHLAVKTGTTNFGFDGLMASWTTQYTAVTWVGYHTRNKAMHGPGMEYMTEPIVRSWMQGALDASGMKPINWQKPPGVKVAPAYVVRNHVGIGSIEPSPSSDLYPAWYNPPKSSSTAKAAIDIVSNKAATSCTPDLARKDQEGANANIFALDPFDPRGSAISTAGGDTSSNDDVHNCNDSKPTVTINSPTVCKANTSCSFTVAVSQGTHPLSGGTYGQPPAGTLTFYINDTQVEVKGIPGDTPDVFNYTFHYTPPVATTITPKVTVVDSVLYDASDSDPITVSN
jgi:membrane peptidoglycan carboxypeptidase